MIQLHTGRAPRHQTQTLRELLAPVAWRIRLARRDRQLTWRHVARAAGLRTATLRRVETGEHGLTAATVGRIARALGIDEEELYPGGRPDAFWERVAGQMRQCHSLARTADDLPLAA